MLYDIVIRSLAAVGLGLIINSNGITTTSVVMSICVFLLLEISLLFNQKPVYLTLTGIPFVISFVYMVAVIDASLPLVFSIFVLGGFTFISTILWARMMELQAQLHRTRDDSFELESILKDKNKRLLSEQDQQVHLATLAERNRIAREIHDNVGHLLSRAILLLGAITTVNKY